MTTNTLFLGTGILDWTPQTGFLPSVIPNTPNNLVPECIDAVIAEWNPRVSEQITERDRVPRVPSLQDHPQSQLGYTKLHVEKLYK